MKNIEFTILYCGHVENDTAWNFACQDVATLSEQDKKRQWGKFPSYCVLIRHPDIGYLLYDTGPGIGDDTDRRPKDINERFPLFIKREEFVDERLRQLGLTVNDISTIIISHTHWDHYGGITFFTGTPAAANVYVPRRDFEAGLAETHSNPEGISTAYHKLNYETPGIRYHFIDGDFSLADGINIYLMAGHTPGVASLLVQTDGGNYLFPSDTVYSRKNYGPPLMFAGLVYDTLGVVKATDKIRRLENEYDATIIFPHDMEQLQNFQWAPYWYK